MIWNCLVDQVIFEKLVEQRKRATWFKNDWAWVFIKNWSLYINIGKALKHWRWNKFQKAFALEFYIT